MIHVTFWREASRSKLLRGEKRRAAEIQFGGVAKLMGVLSTAVIPNTTTAGIVGINGKASVLPSAQPGWLWVSSEKPVTELEVWRLAQQDRLRELFAPKTRHAEVADVAVRRSTSASHYAYGVSAIAVTFAELPFTIYTRCAIGSTPTA